MLADKLNAINSRSQKHQCRIPHILTELSTDDKTALIGALADSTVSIRAICETLRTEGIPVSRDAMTRGRLCITGAYPCKCGIPTIGEN